MHSMHAAMNRGASVYRAPVLVGVQTANVLNNTTITVTKPTGTKDGDLVVAFVMAQSTQSWTVTGFTETVDGNDIGKSVCVAYRTSASDGASYSFVASGNANLSAIVATFRHAAFDVAGSISAAVGDTNAIVPGVTAAGPFPLLLALGFTTTASVTFTSTGMEQIGQVSTATRPSLTLFQQIVSPGATGTRTLTASSSAPYGYALALKRAA